MKEYAIIIEFLEKAALMEITKQCVLITPPYTGDQ